MNLNGLWQFAPAAAGDPPPQGRDLVGQILVPFPVESALSGVMARAERLWYRRTFEVPPTWAGRRVLLHFGAVDWEATVHLNGRRLGVHRGGYDAFSFDATEALRPSGPQELIVGVFDPTDAGDQPRGKQVSKPEGIWYTPTTGIWQTVWLEPVPASRIADLVIVPDVDGRCVRLRVKVAGAEGDLAVEAVAGDGSDEVGRASGAADGELAIPVPSPKLWSPDSPHLYGLRVALRAGGRTLDEVTSYFGMRQVKIGRDEKGVARIRLNGRFLFQVGLLDQGFWPDGLYTAPTDEALRYDLETARRLGFNMVRKHVKVEPERWYYWADRLGVLVWQDMPSAANRTAEGRHQFEAELQRLVEGLRNHPSIILWVIFNEGWGQYDTERLTRQVRQMDPTRLVTGASGWTDAGVGHVMDIHHYPEPQAPGPEPDRAIVLGEFGGLGLAVEGHTWEQKTWGYQGTSGREQLTEQYVAMLRTCWRLRDDPGLNAVVYTQLTDVETECNGLVTYDRAVVKADAARVAAANGGK
jgi:beta-galactosidase/beta-glucuronidase